MLSRRTNPNTGEQQENKKALPLQSEDCVVRLIDKVGFYWVKKDEWEIAFLDEEGWWTCGSEVPKPDIYFEEVGTEITSEYQPVRGNT